MKNYSNLVYFSYREKEHCGDTMLFLFGKFLVKFNRLQ
ncbi:hypothetical protein X874_19570 [Mannheimia varigena USDA-ARS-USMARC-1312]|uniref:Uncharacterized protein n=1 Tax=Mannheimia varigena USDA-ARS-USMARC-1296 TaxID=1433287 RepID=W0QE93_9PAST|nr:hypothetical protein X808_20840 [Mannheimia varigena USDA-ARS-USMARC-1296]AHG78590.1 hypothetical protein X874_19570 [Mannheimia varigena USDA-ARS-USMARC-1312]